MSRTLESVTEEIEGLVSYHRDELLKYETALEVLSNLNKEGEEEAPRPPAPPLPEKIPYPTEAIRNLFDADPERVWRPSEVARELESMMDRGELQAKKGRKPGDFAYSIIADLTKQGFLRKLQPPPGSRSPSYVRATKHETNRAEDELGF